MANSSFAANAWYCTGLSIALRTDRLGFPLREGENPLSRARRLAANRRCLGPALPRDVVLGSRCREAIIVSNTFCVVASGRITL